MKKEQILLKLNDLKSRYADDGVIICGLFGSYARGEESKHSDIDIAYKLDHELFLSKYKGFAAASKIVEVAQEIEKELNAKIDFVSMESINSDLNYAIKQELYL